MEKLRCVFRIISWNFTQFNKILFLRKLESYSLNIASQSRTVHKTPNTKYFIYRLDVEACAMTSLQNGSFGQRRSINNGIIFPPLSDPRLCHYCYKKRATKHKQSKTDGRSIIVVNVSLLHSLKCIVPQWKTLLCD
jgi:hypothetical protein